MAKYLKISKTVLYIAVGILLFLFNNSILPYAAFFVGGVVLAFALEEFCHQIAKRRFTDFAGALIQIIFAVLLFLSHGDIVKICVMWGAWTIFRECRELAHAWTKWKSHILAFFEMIESVALITLSFFLILSPTERQVTIHLIFLGVELILDVTFPQLEALIQTIKRKKEKPGSEDQQ